MVVFGMFIEVNIGVCVFVFWDVLYVLGMWIGFVYWRNFLFLKDEC